jgi:hypothetical protein
LVHDESIIIEDFAKYLMSKWLIRSVKCHINNFFNLFFYLFFKFSLEYDIAIYFSIWFQPQYLKFLVCHYFNSITLDVLVWYVTQGS